jgi:VWFA-related protein
MLCAECAETPPRFAASNVQYQDLSNAGNAMLDRALTAGLCSLCLLTVAPSALAQSPDTSPPPENQIPTLQMSTRVVLTDVTVTDSDGNPVRGLTRSDFHIFDDNHPQPLASFEEHAETPSAVTVASASPNTVSNDFLLHPPSTVNILLIDTTNIGLLDQMYLYDQLTRFVNALPSGQPIAIYNRSGDVTLLLQNFTADRDLLLAAIRHSVPQFRSANAPYENDYDALQQMATYLNQIPGRKNLIWLSGGSNALIYSNPANAPDLPSRRPFYDLLESERIAVDPIDVRGLSVGNLFGSALQQMQMAEDAKATGGTAFYNNNGIGRFVSHTVANDGSYYTFTYSPQNLRRDGKWHQVTIKLDNPHYHLSYRRGYFDDGANNEQAPGKTRTMLRADGHAMQVPNYHGEPIIFQARVPPAAISPAPALAGGIPEERPRRGQTAYSVHYMIPAADIQASSVNGNIAIDSLKSAIVAFDHFGNPVGRVLQAIKVNVDETKLQADPHAVLAFDQRINLPSGDVYLFLVVFDMTSNRFGAINLPVAVQKPSK